MVKRVKKKINNKLEDIKIVGRKNHIIKEISNCNKRNEKISPQRNIKILEKSQHEEKLSNNLEKEQKDNIIINKMKNERNNKKDISKIKSIIENEDEIQNKNKKNNKTKIKSMNNKLYKEDMVNNRDSEFSKEKNLNFSEESELSYIHKEEGTYDKNKEKINQIKNNEDKDYNIIIMNNKSIWCKHLEIDISLDPNNFILFSENFKAINSIKKNNFEVLTDIIIKLANLITNRDEDINIYKGNIEKELIYRKWNIILFKGYYKDIWKRKSNISNYKKRNNVQIEKLLKNQWKIILNFIGWDKDLNYDNIYNYFWFIWFLPNKLLIIWLSKLNSLSITDNWWVKLLIEWEEFWIEILRSGGIKNWIRNFIKEEEI